MEAKDGRLKIDDWLNIEEKRCMMKNRKIWKKKKTIWKTEDGYQSLKFENESWKIRHEIQIMKETKN